MAVTAALVKELRERTAAGMLDCKNALVEAYRALIHLPLY